MDVFLEDRKVRSDISLLARLAVARPLLATTQEELVTEAAALGRADVRYVSVRRQQALRMGEHLIRDVLDEYGISVSSIGFAGGFTGVLGLSFAGAVEDTRRAIETAVELDTKALVIVPGERGLHTYRHAERTVRDGLIQCCDMAARNGIRLLIPTDTVLGGPRDCFRPKDCLLAWLQEFCSDQLQPMIVVRGRTGAWRFPRGWRLGLSAGGCIRICHRCDSYADNTQLMHRILGFLGRRDEDDDAR
jgi:hypothetical protein